VVTVIIKIVARIFGKPRSLSPQHTGKPGLLQTIAGVYCKRLQRRPGMKLTRRGFAALAAGPALAAQQQSPAPPANPEQRRGTPPEVPPFSGPIEFSRKDVAPRVRPFAMTQVRLLAGPFETVQEWNRAYMSRLPADRLVRNFRVNAGLSTEAKAFGG